MTAVGDLLDELKKHQLAGPDEGFYGCCVACDADWPCVAYRAVEQIRRLQACNVRLLAEHRRHSVALELHKARADALESRAVHVEKQLARWAHAVGGLVPDVFDETMGDTPGAAPG